MADSDEPLDEAVEIAWMQFLARFDKIIYPTLFEPRKIGYETALIMWNNAELKCVMELVVEKVDELSEILTTEEPDGPDFTR